MAEEKGYESERKLCFMEDISKDQLTFGIYKTIVENPQYVCKGCGRVARNENNLCAPEKL